MILLNFSSEYRNNNFLVVYRLSPSTDGNFQVDVGVNPSSGLYEIRTLVPYRPYEQVFISYGPHDNTRLLAEYGFVLPDNQHNTMPVDMGAYQIFTSFTSLHSVRRSVDTTVIPLNRNSKQLNKCFSICQAFSLIF